MLVQSQIFRKPVTIDIDEPINKAVKLIFDHRISLLPVLKNKKLVGVIAEKDILKKLLPSMKEFIQNSTAHETFEAVEKHLPDYLMHSVSFVMQDRPLKITMKTPLLKAQSIMLLHKIHRLPVVNKKNEVVGIITQSDIFRALAGHNVQSDSNQFHEWYAQFYDLIEPTEEKENPEVKALDKLFQKHDVYRVVDIFCGSGGHDIGLGERSYELLGLNKYMHFHEAAIKKLEQHFTKNYRGTRPSFLCGNYLKLLQERTADFDAALLMGNALSHHVATYKEILQALDTSLVKKDAVLVVQLTNYYKTLEHLNNTQYFKIVANPDKKNVRYGFLEMFNAPDLSKKQITYTICVMRNEGQTWEQYSVNSTPLAYLTEDSIRGLLKKNGFPKLEVFGSRYYEDPFKQKFNRDVHDWINVIASR